MIDFFLFACTCLIKNVHVSHFFFKEKIKIYLDLNHLFGLKNHRLGKRPCWCLIALVNTEQKSFYHSRVCLFVCLIDCVCLLLLQDIYLHNPDVRWDDIIGLDAAKRLVKEAVVYPIKVGLHVLTNACLQICCLAD